MSKENILLIKEDKIATVTINRPRALNALNSETLIELAEVMGQLDNDSEIRAIILTGAGEKAFVAGADIAFIQGLTPAAAKNFALLGQNTFNKIEKLSKPVIAAINGFALGGGCELAMACDLRVASTKAKFGQPEVNLGLIAGFGGTQRLARLVNPGVAKEMLFTGDIYSAEEAQKMGLVNQVVAGEELLDFCKTVAGKIASRSPVAVKLTKEAANNGIEMDLEKALAYEANLFALAFTTEDHNVGINAFLNKKKPEFKGN
ncbi:enoyl-CoA hydratase-related protein [Thermodesulfovibrionales bacterium]|nr:enoyl-CoA hydratase-related protein [Thermodesulfovibrionales bacterium]